jgi:hypothetical protein
MHTYAHAQLQRNSQVAGDSEDDEDGPPKAKGSDEDDSGSDSGSEAGDKPEAAAEAE